MNIFEGSNRFFLVSLLLKILISIGLIQNISSQTTIQRPNGRTQTMAISMFCVCLVDFHFQWITPFRAFCNRELHIVSKFHYLLLFVLIIFDYN